MRAGLLTKRIEIYRINVAVNEYGEKIKDERLLTSCRANIVYNNGNRSLDVNSEINFNYSYSFEVYSHINVNENDIIHHDGKRYRILSIENRRFENRKIIRTELINE